MSNLSSSLNNNIEILNLKNNPFQNNSIENEIWKEEKDRNNDEKIRYYKMLMIYNAIDDGWTVRKVNGVYKFNKRNEDRDEMLKEGHIDKFLKESIEYLSNIFSS